MSFHLGCSRTLSWMFLWLSWIAVQVQRAKVQRISYSQFRKLPVSRQLLDPDTLLSVRH